MVDLKLYGMAFIALAGCLFASPTYLTYGNTSNVTGFDSALDYAATTTTTATNYPDTLPVLMLAVVFLGFYVVGSRYTQERALVYASFMSVIAAFILVSMAYLNPIWLMLCIFALIAAIYFSNRVG